ncbi:hypothetical protein [Bifidobacterium sp. SO1]|uniref:hypothetical protein n=1 Tax=Bifidobacterium sp. SO1 TaxID=2809029 RepID=UPI001BDD828D|nr:hypothetical protein [Bifidobacterium sp. SO1]MBT1162212.1 hypothetical protein [Bifidobacterium sp. SO1]
MILTVAAIVIGSTVAYAAIPDGQAAMSLNRMESILTVFRERPDQTWYWLNRCRKHDFSQVPIMERRGRFVNGRFTGSGFPVEELERNGVNMTWNPLQFRWEAVTNKEKVTVSLVADCTTLGEVTRPPIETSTWKEPS